MAQKTKGPRPENADPSSSHRPNSRVGQTNSTTAGVSVNTTTLAALQTRLIPLCRPLSDQPGCTCPHHNKERPCASPGKAPIERGWADPSHVSKWPLYPHNVGVRCGAGCVVLDIDPRAGGTERLAQLEQSYGRLPAAPEVLTGGGGRHLYMRGDPEQLSWKLPGVELKAAGSQVVAPGSLHESGRKYDWAADRTLDDVEIPPLPDWLRSPPSVKEPKLKVLPPDPDPRREVWKGDTLTWDGNEYALDHLLDRARKYLDSMPESVSGRGGHEVAFRVAVALVRGFLLPERAARASLAEWNEKRCKPKWGKGELEHKLDQAATKVREPHWRWGYLLHGTPSWPSLEESSAEEVHDSDEDEGEGQPKSRTIEPRLVYISAHDKFMWFEEGVLVPGLTEWQSFFNANGAVGMLQSAGYTFKKASTFIKEKRCHIVKDFSGHVPTNQRIVQGADGKSYLNLPQHLMPTPEGGATPLLDQLFHTIAGRDKEAEDWLWNWAAYIVQNPNVLPGICVVVRGPQGVGKSKLGEAIGYCRGAYVAVSNSIFREQFNSKWSDARFVAAAEVMLSDSRKEHADRFKAWITDPFIEYHKKNVPEFNIQNRIAWWLSSNDDNPVVVPAGDRRFTILEATHPEPAVKQSLIEAWRTYDRREHEWPELKHLCHKLLHYKVDVGKARNPLYNRIHDEHQDASKSSVEMFADFLRTNGWRPLAARYPVHGATVMDNMPPEHIGVDGALLYKTYQLWTKDHGMGAYGYPRFINSGALKGVFHKTPQRRVHGIHYRFWVLPIGVDPENDAD